MVRTKQTIETIVISVVSLGCLMASKAELERAIKRLNKNMGFKGRSTKRLKNGKLKFIGSGFGIEYVYGKSRVEWRPKNTSGTRDVSPLQTKAQTMMFIRAMNESLRYYKDRTKLK